MKQTKVLNFIHQERAKHWLEFQLCQLRESLDPNLPPLYIVDVQGKRGDGIVFTVNVRIDKAKYELLSVKEALKIAQQLLNNGVRELMTFTGCPCTLEKECERHKR